MDTYKHLVQDRITDSDIFVRATFSGERPRSEHAPAWRKVTVRPVLIKDERHLQFVYFSERQSFTENYAGADCAVKVAELLDMPFKNIFVQTTAGDVQVGFNKKGKPRVHHHAPSASPEDIVLSHDHQKAYALTEQNAAPVLQAVGIMGADGQVKMDMYSKFRQINQFLKLMGEVIPPEVLEADPLTIVDCGCGNAYLTFATVYYFAEVLGLPVRMTGIDVNADLIAENQARAEALGWGNMRFIPLAVRDFQPEQPPAIVLALHACDTATDEALAGAIRWQSRCVFSAPCCHHELQTQLPQGGELPPDEAFAPVLQHGILRERLGDILTDTFRARILELAGYQTGVLEFISTIHTPKNLMIRAIRQTESDPDPCSELRVAYDALKAFWQVTPYLETLLAGDFP